MTARNLSYSEMHMIRNKNIIEKITIREFICVGGSLNLPVYNQIYHALQKN